MAKFNAFGKERGWIELIYGPMFAGKSEELLRKLKRLDYADVPYLIFKPTKDSRTNSSIKSRNGFEKKAIEFRSPYEIFNHVIQNKTSPQVIAIDEAQFASIELIDVCDTLANSGVIVYISGLDKDFKNEPFEVISKLSCLAEHVTKLSAVCTDCGAPGTCTQRSIEDKPANYSSPIVQIGNYESYTVKCRHHHIVKNKPVSKESKMFSKTYKN